MNDLDHNTVIKQLNLSPLPDEGGYFREVYRSDQKVLSSTLGEKDEYTSIYYLITASNFSALHMVDQDEIFHFYGGSPVEMIQISDNGNMKRIILGSEITKSQKLQTRVKRGIWQGMRILDANEQSWSLMGCNVSPGFEFTNFHIQTRDELIKKFPSLEHEIIKYTYS